MSYFHTRIYRPPRRTKRRLAAPGPVGATVGLHLLPTEVSVLTVRANPKTKPVHVFGLHLRDVEQDPFSLAELAHMNDYLARGGTVDLLGHVLERAADREETLADALDSLEYEASRTIALVPRAARVVLDGLEAASAEVSLALDDGSSFPGETGITGWDVELPDGSDACAVCVSDQRVRVSPWLIVRDPQLIDVLNADFSRRLARGLKPVEAAAQLVTAACGMPTANQSAVSR